VTSNIDIVKKVRLIDAMLFDEVNLLGVLASMRAFDAAMVNGHKRLKVRYVSLDGGLVVS
jgi:hypothetical protein|tara:strand:+ start:1012 stop:1191 length:180 start_codon:yes stop_codon:yes gene_type:complete